jgi:hypothetical protein
MFSAMCFKTSASFKLEITVLPISLNNRKEKTNQNYSSDRPNE